ncbi:MAG: hypothetical protein ACHREM_10435 [Polyangiales bacterium]
MRRSFGRALCGLSACLLTGGGTASTAPPTAHESPWLSRDPSGRFVASVDARGVELASPNSDWHAHLALSASDDASAARVSESTAKRVEIDHGSIVEWIEENAKGLEQGFVVARAPDGSDAIEIAISVTGSLRPRAVRGRVALVDRGGVARLGYGELTAYDARGLVLPSTMSVHDDRIVLDVDARGAAYPVVVDPLAWSQDNVFQESDTPYSGSFGSSVATDGDTVVVGAVKAAYVFSRVSTGWTLAAELEGEVSRSYFAFGMNVGLSGDSIIVGEQVQEVGLGPYPIATVYARSGGAWSLQSDLIPTTSGVQPATSSSVVAIDGDTAVVGGVTCGSGVACVVFFSQSGGTWTQTSMLTATSDPGTVSLGSAVALQGDVAILGSTSTSASSGATYVATRTSGVWTLGPAFAPPSPLVIDGRFGAAVALDGGTAIISDPASTIGGGAVYAYTGTATTWTYQGALPRTSIGTGFGASVAISGDFAVVGDLLGDTLGAARLFQRAAGVWSQVALLTTTGSLSANTLGTSVAVASGLVVSGATAAGGGGVSAAVAWDIADVTSCTVDGDCATGHCADAVCCDTACTDSCGSCALTGSLGRCTPVAGAPVGGRAPCTNDGTACGGVCNGKQTACTYESATTACGASASCTAGVETSGRTCDGAGSCVVATTNACGPYPCVGNVCGDTCSTSGECAVGAACDPSTHTCSDGSVDAGSEPPSEAGATGDAATSSDATTGDAGVDADAVTSSDAPTVSDATSTSDSSLDAATADTASSGTPAAAASSGCGFRVSTSASAPGGAPSIVYVYVLALVAAQRRRRTER